MGDKGPIAKRPMSQTLGDTRRRRRETAPILSPEIARSELWRARSRSRMSSFRDKNSCRESDPWQDPKRRRAFRVLLLSLHKLQPGTIVNLRTACLNTYRSSDRVALIVRCGINPNT